MVAKIPVILNVDTGVDDAFAITLAAASEMIEILAITTSFGGNTVGQTTENTLRIAELLGLDVPVAAGAAGPLIPQTHELLIGSAAQGEDGLGNKSGLLPYPVMEPAQAGAVEVMAEAVASSGGGVVIVSTCPLTNVAVFLLAHPSLKDKLDGVVFSGGAMFSGNVLPTVEANVFADPEAAQIVLKSGVRLLICGLNATNGAYLTFEDRERFRIVDTVLSAFLREALIHYSDHYENLLLKDGPPLHDVVPVAWLIDPSSVKTEPFYVEIDLNGQYTRGATVMDVQRLWGKKSNAAVATEVDRGKVAGMIFESLRKTR